MHVIYICNIPNQSRRLVQVEKPDFHLCLTLTLERSLSCRHKSHEIRLIESNDADSVVDRLLFRRLSFH
jgi:hypothetical protein